MGRRREQRREERETFGRGGTANRYRMRQKLVAFGDDFWIENESGQRVYKVDGKMLRVRDTLFFEDTNGDGVRNEEEPGFSSWTPRLLKAAYNYQYVQKDPGAFAHNGKYVIQFLYDTLSNLGQRVTVDMAGMVRPDAPAAAQ